MPISPVGSTTNIQVLGNEKPEPFGLATSSLGHSEHDEFEMRAQSKILTAYMRMREGGNTVEENAADQKIMDQAMKELEKT